MRRLLPRKPCLILIMGVAGSGKSTLAREIVRRFHAVYLDNNQIVDAFFPDTRNGRAYEKLRPSFYRALYSIAEENLKLGNSVLLDVPHIKEVQRARWRAFINRLVAGARGILVVIRCFCSPDTLRARLRSRAEVRDRWKMAHWNEFLREQPIRLRMPWRHVDIDTEKPLEGNVRTALRFIQGELSLQRAKKARVEKIS